jgi:hypothetical protein
MSHTNCCSALKFFGSWLKSKVPWFTFSPRYSILPWLFFSYGEHPNGNFCSGDIEKFHYPEATISTHNAGIQADAF